MMHVLIMAMQENEKEKKTRIFLHAYFILVFYTHDVLDLSDE